MSGKLLEFKRNEKMIDFNKQKLLILEEKERKMGKNPSLKEWFQIKNMIRKIKKELK